MNSLRFALRGQPAGGLLNYLCRKCSQQAHLRTSNTEFVITGTSRLRKMIKYDRVKIGKRS